MSVYIIETEFAMNKPDLRMKLGTEIQYRKE
jgi:hypothetical protein